MEVWPDDLPQRVLRDDYQEALGDGRLRTPMDAGPPKMRRRFSAVPETRTASFRVSTDEKERLKRFWRESLAGGSLPFLVRDSSTDGWLLGADADTLLTDENGAVLMVDAWMLVMFEQPPTFTPKGVRFIASFPLIVLP